MYTEISTPLTNLQLELLKVFSTQVSDDDLREIKKMIVRYFADKSMNLADRLWDDNKWGEEKEKEILNEHLRTQYKSSENHEISN